MDEQLEMIEEIEELSVEEPKNKESEQAEPPKEEIKTEVPQVKEEIKELEEPKVEEKTNELVQTEGIKEETKEVKQKSNKGKNILTIILAILLFIDLAALIIYLIGIEKVLSFVK